VTRGTRSSRCKRPWTAGRCVVLGCRRPAERRRLSVAAQAAYIRKEREYRSRIELLEREMARSKGALPADGEVDAHRVKLRQLHSAIMSNIEQVQDQTAKILQEQERDLLRAFRARLFDVQTELEKANARATSGAQEWVDKCKRLEKELEWARETADRLDRHNQALSRENAQLKTQFKTQEDDREYLVRQLVAAKKDNARLRQDLAGAQQELFESRAKADELEQRLAEAVSVPVHTEAGDAHAAVFGGDETKEDAGGGTAVSVGRLRETVRRLRRVLETERKALKHTRQSLALEMQGRTEIERLFRKCVSDVQSDIAARKATAMSLEGGSGSASLEALTSTDRREVMRRLLQQEEVLRRLSDVAFPASRGSLSAGGSRLEESRGPKGSRPTSTIVRDSGALSVQPILTSSSPGAADVSRFPSVRPGR
jgi:hypothetical protein